MSFRFHFFEVPSITFQRSGVFLLYIFLGDHTTNDLRLTISPKANIPKYHQFVSKYPKYANSNFVNELTNVGYFFDNTDNNKYTQQKILPENCKLNGESLTCELNGKQHEIPNSLLNYNTDVVDSIGVVSNDTEIIQSPDNYQFGLVDGKDYQIWNYPDDNVMNGGKGFDGIYASNPLGENESYGSVTNRLGCKSCSI